MTYHTITNQNHTALKAFVTKERYFTKSEIEEDVTHDELQTVKAYPDAYIKVKTKDEIASIMQYCNTHNIPLTVRGSGTGLVGACVPIHGGVLLDMSLMNKILELDPVNLTLRLEPGVLLMEIAEYVEKQGLFYAPDPGEKSATIGGNIATNAGGMRAVKYGVTRDWVRGLEVVLPSGDIIQCGGKIVKNSTGYSIKDLIIGSEGTLGIITEVILKLIPLPKETISLLVPFKSKEEAIKAVPSIITKDALPTAVEYLEDDSLAFSEEFLGKQIPHNDFPAYLLLSYDGNSFEVIDHIKNNISAHCVNECNAVDVYTVDTEERKESVWSARGAFLEAIKASTTEIDECDVVLPRSEIGDYLDFTNELSKELDIRIPYFGHVGDGNLHIYFCKDELDDTSWKQVKEKGFKAMYNRAFEVGGLISGEHGIGYAKREYLEQQLGTVQLHLLQQIKKAFDPNNILNPGKVV